MCGAEKCVTCRLCAAHEQSDRERERADVGESSPMPQGRRHKAPGELDLVRTQSDVAARGRVECAQCAGDK